MYSTNDDGVLPNSYVKQLNKRGKQEKVHTWTKVYIYDTEILGIFGYEKFWEYFTKTTYQFVTSAEERYFTKTTYHHKWSATL